MLGVSLMHSVADLYSTVFWEYLLQQSITGLPQAGCTHRPRGSAKKAMCNRRSCKPHGT